MTAGLAHDVRNVLNVLSLRLQNLERAVTAGEPTRIETVAQLRKDVQLGVELLERVRTFGRASTLARAERIDLNDIVSEACALARLRVSETGLFKGEIRRDLGAVSPMIGQHGELVSAVLNLLLNAIDASSPQAIISVRTRETNRRLWLVVEDHGPGIAPEVKKHIFEPFFTTKGSHGTGLGLASVAECARRHQGEVRVRSARGRGTAVSLWFPSAGARARNETPPE